MPHFHYGPLQAKLRTLLETSTQRDLAEATGISRSHFWNILSPKFVEDSIGIYPLVQLCNLCDLYLPSLMTIFPTSMPLVESGRCYFDAYSFQSALHDRYVQVKKNGKRVTELSGLKPSTLRQIAYGKDINPSTATILGGLQFVEEPLETFFPRVDTSLLPPVALEVAPEPVVETVPVEDPQERIANKFKEVSYEGGTIPAPAVEIAIAPLPDAPTYQLNTQLPETIPALRKYISERIRGFIPERAGLKYCVSVAGISREMEGKEESFIDYAVSVHNVVDLTDVQTLVSFNNSGKNLKQAYHQFEVDIESHFFG